MQAANTISLHDCPTRRYKRTAKTHAAREFLAPRPPVKTGKDAVARSQVHPDCTRMRQPQSCRQETPPVSTHMRVLPQGKRSLIMTMLGIRGESSNVSVMAGCSGVGYTLRSATNLLDEYSGGRFPHRLGQRGGRAEGEAPDRLNAVFHSTRRHSIGAVLPPTL